MLKVGLTGGIGSGKSVVAKIFAQLGVAIYDADSAAKMLMNNNENLKNTLKENFGDSIYKTDGTLNRKKLSDIVFADNKKRDLINALVHPAVAIDFDNWCKKQKARYIIKEAAILFESGANKGLDKTISVSAPVELRISRVIERDKVSPQKVLSIIAAQLTDEERKAKSDFEVINDGQQALIPQVLSLHKIFSHQ